MLRNLLSALVTAAWATSVQAANLAPVELSPVSHQQASLTIVDASGAEHSFTPAELENFDTYRMRTTTPWREQAADFDGVLLTDLLAQYDLDDIDSIVVTAENDYTTIFTREVWESIPVLVATRVNGEPHTRRERGPIQFVIADTYYNDSSLASESHLVWMAKRIEPE